MNRRVVDAVRLAPFRGEPPSGRNAPVRAERARLKRAELAGSLGALVLGAGLGAGGARLIGTSWPAVLLLGLASHAWGMWNKHRIEAGTLRPSPWEDALYWICWALVGAVVLFLLQRIV